MFYSKKLSKENQIKHCFFNRLGGKSKGIYKSLNCGRGSLDNKKHINKNKYTLRWRGQYLVGGEDWRKYQQGQPMNKSKCIRVYIDNKGSTETTEGFNLQEIDIILDGLYHTEDECQSFIDCWDYKGNEKCEDVVSEKVTLKRTLSLQKYFKEMKVHLEECQSNMAETNNVT